MLGSQTGRRLRVREPFFHGALCRACCEDVHVLCQEDRIMYQPEFCAVWLDRLTSKSNGHGLLFSVQFRVWAGVCSDAPAFSAAACKRLSLVHKAIR